MDVTRYVAQARAAVEAIAGRGRAVLVTGGSGFYLKSYFAPVTDSVAVSPELRMAVAARREQEGVAVLVTELLKLNPGGLGALDVDNPRRVTRALERCIATGRTLAELKAEFLAQPGAFADWRVELVRLERPADDLNARITVRVAEMLRRGLVEEVRQQRSAGLELNPSAARAIGYREVLAVLDGQLPERELAAEIVKNTRGLVRKQRTWFRTQLPEHRVVDADAATVAGLFAS